MIYLENEFIKASFSSKGAELQELINKASGENYLWNGDPAFWGKFSPILFPIVGGLKENTYNYQNRIYTLSRHGFARDMEFSLKQISRNELLFTLSDTPETFAVYPFEFSLGVRYKLVDSSLICRYEITNPGTEDLLFSIGGHPAFILDTSKGVEYDDYYLEFDKDSTIEFHEIDADLISNNTHRIELKEGKLNLTHELFYNDALVFKTLKSQQISIGNNKNKNKVHFEFHDFPYFGIWAAKDADFICLEPWCGIADVVGHNQDLENKEGINSLNPKQSFSRAWTVTIV